MNKWTMLSIVVLIGIVAASLWMITQSHDPLLEAESAAEQEIGVEEFDAGTQDSPVAEADDADTILEPDLTVDDSGAEEEEEEPANEQPMPIESEAGQDGLMPESEEKPAEQPETP